MKINLRLGWSSSLTLLFIGLKMAGYISWSWWLVLLPVTLSVAGYIAFIISLSIWEYCDPCGYYLWILKNRRR